MTPLPPHVGAAPRIARRAGRATPRAAMFLAALGVAGVVASACGSSAPPPPAKVVLGTASKAIEHAGSVHFLQVTKDGKSSTTLSGQLGPDLAQETLYQGRNTVQVRLVHHVLYLNAGGNASVLVDALGLTQAQAARGSREWVAVSLGEAPYAHVTQSLSLKNQVDQFIPVEPGLVNQATVSVRGTPAIPVAGSPASAPSGAHGTSTLYVATDAPYLPYGGHVVLTKGAQTESSLVAFTQWGVPLVIKPPAHSVSYAYLSQS